MDFYNFNKEITISLCMIVKNEEDVIARCINSIKDAIDEIIIVDTGSNDNTIELALSLGAKVYNYKWNDDFGAARNYAFSKATMEYIMWLDADDIIKEKDLKRILNLKKNFDTDIESVNMRYVVSIDKDGNESYVVKRNRIVKREIGFRWIGFIHEFLAVSNKVLYTDIQIFHQKEKEKTDRNIRIYKEALKNGVILSTRDKFYYSNELYHNGFYEEAIEAYNVFLQDPEAWIEDIKTALISLSKCYELIGNDKMRIDTLLSSFKYMTPRSDYCCEIGYYFLDKKEYNKAIHWYKLATDSNDKETIGLLDHGTYTWIPNLQLCVCYFNLGDYEKSNYYNEQAAKYVPSNSSVIHNRKLFKNKKIG
ncbi:MAG: tetratricopeptide repeat-containing glycosyltransferase family 2 protein [Paraclostridium sp.]